ncbi:hypothetical protein KC19_10G147700, partial [Ceratodon purpureus]
ITLCLLSIKGDPQSETKASLALSLPLFQEETTYKPESNELSLSQPLKKSPQRFPTTSRIATTLNLPPPKTSALLQTLPNMLSIIQELQSETRASRELALPKETTYKPQS